MADGSTVRLRDVSGIEPHVAEALARLGFIHAVQVLGAADVEGAGLDLAQELGISAERLAQVVAAAGRVARLPDSLESGGGGAFGALPPTPALSAEIALLQTSAPAQRAIPPAVSHIAQMPAVRDQGARGACVAFALVAVLEHHLRRQGKSPEPLSEQFVYHAAKQADGAPGSCGTWQVKALQAMARLGACSERLWRYNPTPPCNNNGVEPSAARPDAAVRRCAPVVLGARDVHAARTLLAAGCVLSLSVPVYASWANSLAVRMTGQITMRLASEAAIAGHALCVVGYQDKTEYPGGGYFIVRNSWGPRWAYDSAYGAGYGTIPYAYVANDGWELVGVA